MKRLVGLGLAISVLVAVAALLVVVDLRAGGGGTTTADTEGAAGLPDGKLVAFGVRGTVEYVVRDADGNVREQGIARNTINAEALNETFNRITSVASGGPYDRIVALGVDAITDDPSDGVVGGSVADNLDGDGGIAGDQNPAAGSVTTDFGTETGNGAVAVTFTAKIDGVSVKQVLLSKGAVDDTTQGPNPAIADSDILSFQDVPDVTLNTNDTVQYTWTLDVD